MRVPNLVPVFIGSPGGDPIHSGAVEAQEMSSGQQYQPAIGHVPFGHSVVVAGSALKTFIKSH